MVIDRLHMGMVSNRTFAYERDNDLCHVMINAERATRAPSPMIDFP